MYLDQFVNQSKNLDCYLCNRNVSVRKSSVERGQRCIYFCQILITIKTQPNQLIHGYWKLSVFMNVIADIDKQITIRLYREDVAH